MLSVTDSNQMIRVSNLPRKLLKGLETPKYDK